MKGKTPPMRLGEIAGLLGLDVEGDADIEIRALAPLDEAGEGDLTFVATARYKRLLASTKASAVILAPGEDGGGRPVLRARDPYTAFARALSLFDRRPSMAQGVHPTAVVAPTATIGERPSIGAFVVVGDDVVLGDDAVLHPQVVIYPGARIGNRFTAHAGCVVRENVVIGDHVVLQPGLILGGDGFGFLPRGRELPQAIPQVGSVEVGDHVDIGANTTVDRAAVGATRLGRGVKLDNLVMVGHGSRIGDGTMLAGQTGMAGSTRIGERVMAGGQVGFAGHLTVGDDVRIAARAGVVADVAAGQTIAGFPAVDIALWRRTAAALLRLPDLIRRLRRFEAEAEAAGVSREPRRTPPAPKD
ncbi:MAG: UDP-3-O-(3-hydroxymyristoyl)glucosamine N-acyltransferase [Candidatus Binatia bacterium]